VNRAAQNRAALESLLGDFADEDPVGYRIVMAKIREAIANRDRRAKAARS
jgi:hypothetical protein